MPENGAPRGSGPRARRPAYRHRQAGAAGRLAEFELGAMEFCNPGDDGQAEAAARLPALIESMKAAQNRLALRGRDAGAAVADRQLAAASVVGEFDPDLAARRRIADGIVDQIADQDAQPFRLADHRAARPGLEVEVDVLAEDLWAEIGADRFCLTRSLIPP